MMKWATICAVIALLAGILGFTVIAGAAALIVKVLFFAFLLLFIVLFILGMTAARKISSTIQRRDETTL